MWNWKRVRAFLFLSLPVSFLLAAGAAAAAEKEFIFSLTWVPYGRDVGFYAARDLGLYEREGLRVELVRGHGDGDSLKKVGAGSFHMARIGLPVVILGRSRDIPVRSVAIQYDKSQDVIYALQGSGISKPKDLEGRTLGAPEAGGPRTLFPAFAAANGIDAKRVKWISMPGPAEIPSLLAGKVDGIVTRTPVEPNVVRAAAKAGKGIVRLLYADHGFDIYSSGFAALDKTIQESPAGVRAFVKASLQGHAWAIENPQEGVARFLKYFPSLDAELAGKQWDIAVDHQLTEDALKRGLGYANPVKMKFTVDVVGRHMELKKAVRPEDVYTNDFLPGIYVKPKK